MQVNVTFEGKDASFAAAFAEQMSLMGPEGKSAYQVAVDNGFTGTEKEWLSSLKGKDGQRGADGKVGEKGEKGDPFTYEDFTKEQLEDLRGPKDPTLVRTDVNGKIPASVIPDNVGGVQPDWDETDDNSKAYIKNKPFGDFTAHIKWDGNTSGLEKITIESPYASAVTLYKVYNGTISEEELNGGTIVIDGKEKKLGMGKDVMVIPRDGFIISHPTSLNMMEYIVALNDCQFSSQNPNLSKPYMTKGVYFAEGVTEIRPSKPNIKQIDPKFIPELDYAEKTELQNINNELLKKAEKEHKHDVSEVNGLLKVETGFKIEWDGNPTDEHVDLTVEGNVIATLYKVGDAKTKDELNGSTVKILWSDNRETEFTLTYEHMHDLDNGIAFMIQGINDYDGLFYFISPTACVDVMEEVAVLNFPSAGIWAMSNEDYRPISIINDTYVIKTLNENIIPNSIARTTDLNNKANLVDGVVPQSQLPSVAEMKDFTKEVTQAVNTSLEQAKASGEFDGANGADGYTPVKGVDYFTDEEKAEMVAELSQIEVPTIVSSVDEMTDTSKHYVLEGYIYSSQKVVTQGGTTSPNMFTPTEDCLNMRLSGSTGSTSSNPGSFITDFIPVTNIANETQFIVRLNREVVDYKENKLVYYNASKTRLGTSLLEVGTNTTISNGETVTDIKKLSASSSATPSSWSDVAYIRIQYCLHLTNNIAMSDIENCEVTFDVNNVVTEETIKYQWVNSGISYAPTFRTDLIGVVGEDNVIYLSENLPSGTYTLKYGDETYETIGTITVM